MATTGTLVGTYHKSDGSPKQGTVHITPSVRPVRDAVGNAVITEGIHIALDDTGSFSATLAATDDTTLYPAGVTYTVSLRGETPVTGIAILTGVTTNMKSLVSAASAAPSYAAINGVISVAGHTGVVSVADLTADLGLARFIPHQNTAPSDPNVTPAYVDTSTAPPTVKGWNGATWVAIGGTGSALTIQDEGTPLSTAATVLNYTGSGVTVTGTGGTKTIAIPGGTTYTDENARDAIASALVAGSNVTITPNDGADTITIAATSSSALTVQDEGTPLTTAATTLNFTGSSVTATGTGATKTITVSEPGPFEPLYTTTTASGAISLPAPATATWSEYTLTGDVVFTPPSGFGAAGAGKATALTVVARQPTTGGVYNRQVDWASNVTFLGGTQVAAKAGAGVKTVYTLATSDDGATYIAAGSEVDVGGNIVVTLTDAATVAIDASLGDTFSLTFTAAVGTTRVIATPTNLTDGKRITLRLTQDASGGKTCTFSSGWGGGDDLPLPLNLSSGSNKTDYAGAEYSAPAGKLHMLALMRGY